MTALAGALTRASGVVAAVVSVRRVTDGAFDAFAVPAPNGTMLDPSSFVNGWAVERAAGPLHEQGLGNVCINPGGDVAVRGKPGPRATWRVGIRDPGDLLGLAAVLAVTGPVGIATSGTYERAAHIVDPPPANLWPTSPA